MTHRDLTLFLSNNKVVTIICFKTSTVSFNLVSVNWISFIVFEFNSDKTLTNYQAIVIFGLAFVVNPFEKGFEELTPLQRVVYIEGICWLTTLFIYSLYRIAFPIKQASSSFFIFNKHPKSKIKNHARICKRRGAIRQKTQLTIHEGLL